MTRWRRTPLKPSMGTQWPPRVKRAIRERDGRCVGPRAGFLGECYGETHPDHVRASGALGRKSRSTVDNGALLCAVHHAWKTAHGRVARPLLFAWIDAHPTLEPEDDCGHADPVHGCPDCDSRARRRADPYTLPEASR